MDSGAWYNNLIQASHHDYTTGADGELDAALREWPEGSAWLPSGCCLALCDQSVQAYSDLSWLGLIGFGNLYFKYSVPIGRSDAIVFHGLRQVERSRKFTWNPLDPVVLDPVGWFFSLSLATECQYPLVHFRFEVLVSHPGQLGANEIRILTFKNVHGRIPDSSGSTLLRPGPTERVFE